MAEIRANLSVATQHTTTAPKHITCSAVITASASELSAAFGLPTRIPIAAGAHCLSWTLATPGGGVQLRNAPMADLLGLDDYDPTERRWDLTAEEITALPWPIACLHRLARFPACLTATDTATVRAATDAYAQMLFVRAMDTSPARTAGLPQDPHYGSEPGDSDHAALANRLLDIVLLTDTSQHALREQEPCTEELTHGSPAQWRRARAQRLHRHTVINRGLAELLLQEAADTELLEDTGESADRVIEYRAVVAQLGEQALRAETQTS